MTVTSARCYHLSIIRIAIALCSLQFSVLVLLHCNCCNSHCCPYSIFSLFNLHCVTRLLLACAQCPPQLVPLAPLRRGYVELVHRKKKLSCFWVQYIEEMIVVKFGRHPIRTCLLLQSGPTYFGIYCCLLCNYIIFISSFLLI